jgi:hypothetical protein
LCGIDRENAPVSASTAMIGLTAYGRKIVEPETHAFCSTNGQPRNRAQ